MKIKLLARDPESAYARAAVAQRRAGVDARCSRCGEDRPRALVPSSNPKICYECRRKEKGQTIMENHHTFAKANSPVTVPTLLNDHRAELNVAQHDWPKLTLQNPDGSPLLAAAGAIRGFVDYIIYLIQKGLLWAAEMLEKMDVFLKDKLGPQWWIGTPIEQFAPKR